MMFILLARRTTLIAQDYNALAVFQKVDTSIILFSLLESHVKCTQLVSAEVDT